MRIVVDTNVIASAIFFGGKPYQLLHYIMEGRVDVVASKEIVDEYEEIVLRLKQKYPRIDTGFHFRNFYQNSKLSESVLISKPAVIRMTTSSYLVQLTGNAFILLVETMTCCLSVIMETWRYLLSLSS